MKVDPVGMAGAAQRIAAKVTGTAGAALHPPLANDEASVKSAARLSAAGSELMTSLLTHLSALSTTASQLGMTALMFAEQESINAASTATLSPGAVAPVTGYAGPAPDVPADVRPQFGPAAPMPGEGISLLVHSGTGSDGGFVASMEEVSMFADDTSAVVQGVVDEIDDIWDGPHSMDVAQHLTRYVQGFADLSARARGLAQQSRTYTEQYQQAAADIPTPEEFAAINSQLQQAVALNNASGGRYAALVASLVGQKQALEQRAQLSYTTYDTTTEISTAAPALDAVAPTVTTLAMATLSGVSSSAGVVTGALLGAADGMLPTTPATPPADLAQASDDDDSGQDTAEDHADLSATDADTDTALSQDDSAAVDELLAGGQDTLSEAGSDDQLASMLPTMLPSMLGAASGLMGNAVGNLNKIPEALMQAGTQALTAATEGLSSAFTPDTDIDTGTSDLTDIGDVGLSTSPYSPGGAGPVDTTPAAGTAISAVAPSTGTTPTIAAIPAGAVGPAAQQPAPSSGYGGMPMMPMNPMMGGQQGGNDRGEDATRKLVAPRGPHREQVTGKVATDRIAVAAADTNTDSPTGPEPTGEGPRPIVRRITTPPRDPS